MIILKNLTVTPTSLVSRDDRQLIVLSCHSSCAAHVFLSVFRDDTLIAQQIPLALPGGDCTVQTLLPLQSEAFDAVWQIRDREGTVLAQVRHLWKQPRQWTLYAMLSSHIDLGLHDSQYIQRKACCDLIDAAVKVCDETASEPEENRYRYTMEGTWFWNNYALERGAEAAQKIVTDYILPGKLGVCAGLAGNHFQTFGPEELCRSSYERRNLQETWGVRSETLAMIDINGMPKSMIGPYISAGYKNIIFAPNHWNPLPSTVWKCDRNAVGPDLNPDAGGGGSRVDVRYDSYLPMVYNWMDDNGDCLTVWASTQYGYGGDSFGFYPAPRYYPISLPAAEDKMWKQLERLEGRYPYDLWLFACYDDNQEPDHYVIDQIRQWNTKWKWPKVRALGDPDEPFRQLRQRFGSQIPRIRGDMAGGWYQHPLSVPELMAQKFDAHRQLAAAEKWASAACLTDNARSYPAIQFRRAWDHLLFNDEHSYGTSGYSGRKVYETWMQHRDWIEKAEATAKTQTSLALQALCARIPASEDALVVFNPMGQEILEYVSNEDRSAYTLATIPPFGYRVIPRSRLTPNRRAEEISNSPPVIENRFYRIQFSENGALLHVFDKELNRELLDSANAFRGNELVFTQDNHRTFTTPTPASFEILREERRITVCIRTTLPDLGAEVLQQVTLPDYEKRIDIKNEILHNRAMINSRRYYRYLYCAFPFLVENCRRLCNLNGAVAEYAKDVTGHGTDVYMAAQEWCCSENDDFGVALLMKEHQLTEFDHIHPDKTDYGNAGDGSQIFTYLANDWLQKHTPGGSHIDFCFHYSITSYAGTWQSAGISQLAERFVTSRDVMPISAQEGTLPEHSHSFLPFTGQGRFLCLKRADDGNGLIARFYGTDAEITFEECWNARRETVDERLPEEKTPLRFHTYRLGADSIRLRTEEPAVPETVPGIPAPIGSVYTGLITAPRAAAGENPGQLYLLWGASRDPDFSHYALYRSEISGFIPDEATFLADIQPEDYCVGRYVDQGLKNHSCYYYRVCAVNRSGIRGPFSEEFSAFTREDLWV